MENIHLHTPPPPPPPPPPIGPIATQLPTQEIYNYATTLLITQKKNVNEVTNALIQKGLDAQSASTIITSLQAEVTKQRKIRAKKDMMYGGGVCIVGAAITLVTYAIASSGGGGTYFVSWGAILFGAIQFFRGLFNLGK